MKQYTKYKDTGIKWIGDVPEHWELHKLKHCLQLINNKTYSNSTLVYIGMENIESWSGKYVETSIETDGIANVFQKGNILFGKLRPYLAKVHLAEFDGCCSSELLVYHSKNQNNNYLQKLLITKGFIDLINASTYGSKMPRANSSFIGNQLLPIPPLSEQQSIVRFLEKETANIDAYIKQREQEIATLAELKQAEIATAVTRGLIPDVKMKDSGISWIGEVPEHWEIMQAKNMFKKEKREVQLNDDVITCFRDGQVTLRKNRRTKGFTESITEIGYQGIRKDDLVIHQMDAFAGAVGVSDSNGKGTSVYHCCTPKGDYDTRYYAFLIRKMAFSGFIQSLYKGIRERSSDFNFKIFGNQRLVVPSFVEQQAVVAHIEQRVRQIDDYAAALKSEIEQMQEYKQRLISDTVTGKIEI